MADQIDLERFIEAASKGAMRAVEARRLEAEPVPHPWRIIIGIIYVPQLEGELTQVEGTTRTERG